MAVDLNAGILRAATEALRKLYAAARAALLGPTAPPVPDMAYWPYDAWEPEPIIISVGEAFTDAWAAAEVSDEDTDTEAETDPVEVLREFERQLIEEERADRRRRRRTRADRRAQIVRESMAFRSSYLSSVSNRIVGVGDTVFDEVASQIDRGLIEGDSIPEIRDRVQDVLGAQAMGNRATVIARTESIGANNAGHWANRTDQIQRGEVPAIRRRWLSARDGRVRATHVAANGQERGYDEPFQVGAALLMFPGDPNGPARETIQCRCVTVDLD